MRKGVWHLANFFTFGNALAGVFAIFFAAKGDIEIALRLVALGILFDSLMGRLPAGEGQLKKGKLLIA
jgi:phosphatidylserine synthase